MGRSTIDFETLKRLYSEGYGLKRLARYFQRTPRAIDKHLIRLALKESSRSSKQKLPQADELIELYRSGKGFKFIATKFGASESTVAQKLHSLGVVVSTRQLQPSGLPRRKRRLKSQEFTDRTKRLRFEQESGVCQECHQLIGLHWRQATYHHIVNCKNGGTADPANCMVLHFECHNDPAIFRKLHGFDMEHLDNYNKD